jgi:hypothetical protein
LEVIHDLPLRRIAHQESGHPPGAAIAGDADDVLDVGQRRARNAILAEFEGDAGQKDAVEEALQNGWQAVTPDWEDKDQRLSRQ